MWIPDGSREPDFRNLLTVLRGGVPDRPVLWEFFLHHKLYDCLSAEASLPEEGALREAVKTIGAYRKAGYDYAPLKYPDPNLQFSSVERDHKDSVSMNGGVISSWEDFEQYQWPSPSSADYSVLDAIQPYIPEGMALIPYGPGGVEENVIQLTGYENLCYMMADDPALAKALFDRVGQGLLEYYAIVCRYPFVGACTVNDDWGFNTQTLLSYDQMAEYLYPWHKKIVQVIHAAGKPAILHSCGNLYPDVMERIIGEIGYDGKHSYEDNIKPVEQAYDEYADRIAVIGGIDLDFIIQSTPEAVYKRSVAMLERTAEKGRYCLGTGNSVPAYVPDANYFAMVKAAWDFSS